jgi:hypothetical protein
LLFPLQLLYPQLFMQVCQPWQFVLQFPYEQFWLQSRFPQFPPPAVCAVAAGWATDKVAACAAAPDIPQMMKAAAPIARQAASTRTRRVTSAPVR